MHDPAKAQDSSVATFLDQTDFSSNICQKICIQAVLMCHIAIFIPSQEIVEWRNDEQHSITEQNISMQWL